jgi:hypothetical protein
MNLHGHQMHVGYATCYVERARHCEKALIRQSRLKSWFIYLREKRFLHVTHSYGRSFVSNHNSQTCDVSVSIQNSRDL